MPARLRPVALSALLLAAVPLLAQPAKPTADTLRAEIQVLAWLGSLDLSPADAKEWLAALDGVPALLAPIDAQENAPEVLAALGELRAKVLRGEPITEEDQQAVEEARCRVVAARALDEPEVRRQQALLPLTNKLTANLTVAQRVVLSDHDRVDTANHILALIAAGQREAGDEWRERVTETVNWAKQNYEAKGEQVAKRLGELIEAGRAVKPEDWPKQRAGLRDDLLVALNADHSPKELADEAAQGLARVIVEQPQFGAMLRLWSDSAKKP